MRPFSSTHMKGIHKWNAHLCILWIVRYIIWRALWHTGIGQVFTFARVGGGISCK